MIKITVLFISKDSSPTKDKEGRKMSRIDKRVTASEARKYFQLIENTLRAFQELTDVPRIPLLRKIDIEKENGIIIHQLGEVSMPHIARVHVKSRRNKKL